jgi:hypothetical protein
MMYTFIQSLDLAQIYIGENGFIKVRPVEVRPDEVRPVEVRPAEIRPVEVRLGEVRSAKVCPEEAHLVEVRVSEVRVDEPRRTEVRMDIRILLPLFVPGLHPLLKDGEVFFVGHENTSS